MFEAIDLFLYHLKQVGVKSSRVVFLQGCALGVDTWFGEYALLNDIELHLYLPFRYEVQVVRGNFDDDDRDNLQRQMKHATKVVVVNKKFSYWGYQKRNIALVDNSHILFSWYTRQRSGSGNCVRYAWEQGRWHVDLRQIHDKVNLPFSVHDLASLLSG
jgi:uncharacterized phage-like protein YoqJ